MLAIFDVSQLAAKYNYAQISLNEESRVISFSRDDVRVNVYYTTGTVGTCLAHPTQGKTQLFRRGVDMLLLDEIFRQPRVHTPLGYRQINKGESFDDEPAEELQEEVRKEMSRLDQRISELQQQRKELKQQFLPSRRRNRRRRRRCFHCGDAAADHIGRDCEDPCFDCGGSHPGSRCANDGPKKCYECGRPGHLRAECPAE